MSPHIKLSCRNVWKVYGHGVSPASLHKGVGGLRGDGHIVAAANVSFDVAEGEIFVIMGLSGSGKSTVLRCLSRLVEPTSGQVLLDGEDLLEKSGRELIQVRRHKMGMVFQSFGLLPHLNVIDNVAFPLRLQGVGLTERRRRAEAVINLVGLDGRETSFPHQLSGGQQQRVGLARSLAVEPDLWFLDEPFSALDPLIRRQMQDEFLRLQQKLHKTIVFVTHDFLEALRIADRMMIMRDGEIVQIGTPADLILRPADQYVANFTREVPLTRVITAGQAADASMRPGEAMPRVDAGTVLDDLVPQLVAHPGGVAVTAADGADLGVVTAAGFIDALHGTNGRATAGAANRSP